MRPRPVVRSWNWICEHGRMPTGTPFDGDRIPWSSGVCDAYDDPLTRSVTMMWGTRLGKTITALQLMACMMANAPMKGLFSQSTQSLAKRTVNERIYPMLEAIDATAQQLPPENLRAWNRIALAHSSWNVTWSGSATQLADIDAYYGHAGEIDKWSYNEVLGGEGGEGDALDQWEERFKENPDHKKIFECSPSTKHRSRIYKKLLASNNCRYWVPCLHCKKHQILKFGGKEARSSGGLVWDKPSDGASNPELALSTARYVCEHCRKEIYDEHRFTMMRSGRWAAEGCRVDRRGRVIGTPLRSSRHWGGQLSSLYSLQMRWGDMAEKFVKSVGNPRSLQMYVNGWLADVWEPYRSKSEPDEVGERLVTDVPKGTIPGWATWVFAGCDVQEECLVYVVIAVGADERVAIIDDGVVDTWTELEKECITRKFDHADGGSPLSPALTLIDCGHRTKEVYDFCQRFKGSGVMVMPCKGSNNDCNGEPYQKIVVGDGTKSGSKAMKRMALAARGLVRIRVNPFHYEPLIQQQLDRVLPGERGSLELAAGFDEDDNFLHQICNAAISDMPSKSSPDRHLWVKRWPDLENDKRDCYKYARCAADLKFRGDWNRAARRQDNATSSMPGANTKVPKSNAETSPQSGRRRALRERLKKRRAARRARR